MRQNFRLDKKRKEESRKKKQEEKRLKRLNKKDNPSVVSDEVSAGNPEETVI